MSRPLLLSFAPIRFNSALVALGTLTVAAHAGQVIRVGPTRTHTQITSALNLPPSAGDLILVDPGTYNRFTVDGSIVSDVSIVADSGGSFSIAPSAGQTEITVQNVPWGSTVTIVGAMIEFDDPEAPAVRINGNTGAVRLRRLIVDQVGDLFDADVQACVEVEDTASFWLLDSSIWSVDEVEPIANTLNPLVASGLSNDGVSGLQLVDSGGVVQNTRTRGYANPDLGGFGGDGLRAIGEDTSVWLLQDQDPPFVARFHGGDGEYGGHAVHQVRDTFEESLIRSCGGPDSAVTVDLSPGAKLFAGIGAVGGFYGWNNTNNTIGGGGGVAFKVVEHCADGQRNETVILPDTVSIGTNLQVRLRTRLDRKYLIAFSAVTQYTYPVTPFTGRSMIGTSFTTLTGNSTAQTFHNLSVAIPNFSSLIGVQVTVQGAFGPIGGSYSNLGLPGMVVIGP